MKKILLLSLLTAIVLFSCTNQKESKLKKINELQLAMKSDSIPNMEKSKELVTLYVDFATAYPKDTGAAGYLYKAAKLSEFSNPKYAIELYDKIINGYADDKRAPDCLFFKAFIYDNNLKDLYNARKSYELFLKKYPNHFWSTQIPSLLKILGKTPEQLSAEFEAKNNADSLAVKK